jgi:hypothetical protein
MSRRIAAYVRRNLTALIALFVALGGTAYASNEWTGDNIVNGSLTTNDYKNNDIKGVDVENGTLGGNDLAAGAITSDENCVFPGICFDSTRIADRAVGASEISPGAVDSSELALGSVTPAKLAPDAVGSPAVAPDSLTGADVDESTLDPATLPGPPGFYAFKNDTGQICNDFCTEATLRGISPGAYLIVAKIELLQDDFDADATGVQCKLDAEGDFDFADFADFDDDQSIITLPMEVVHTYTAPGAVSINCRDADLGDVDGAWAKITAIRLGSVNVG